MAHDNYLALISLALDGELAGPEQQALEAHLRSCCLCADKWRRMSLLDRMLRAQPEAAPTPDFTARVMAHVASYEARRHLYPWFTAVLTAILLAATLSVGLPVLFFGLGLYRLLLEIPLVGTLVAAVESFYAQVSTLASSLLADALGWVSYVATDPTALVVVVTALVLASVWIGLLEAFKRAPLAEPAAQGA